MPKDPTDARLRDPRTRNKPDFGEDDGMGDRIHETGNIDVSRGAPPILRRCQAKIEKAGLIRETSWRSTRSFLMVVEGE